MSDDAETAPGPPPSPATWKNWLIPFVVVAVILSGAVGLFAWMRSPIPILTEESLDAAQDRWQETGPRNYKMVLTLRGARPGTISLEVRNRRVVNFMRSGHTPKESRAWQVWSIPGQFETIRRDIEIAEDPQREIEALAGVQWEIRAEFDARYGFPRRYHRIVRGSGPEVYWQVDEFTPL